MIPYFAITYRLLEKHLDGTLTPFERTRDIYSANVRAKTKEQAVERLKRDFNMLTVEIVAVSDKMEMTVEEYKNGGNEA